MRTVLSLVLLAALLWASCTVKLGRFTLAEHVDRIGETDEAKALLAGTRGKIAPVLEDMKQRIFGEYVEAPTAPPKSRRRGERRGEGPKSAEPKVVERGAPSSEAVKLPGRGSRAASPEPKLPAKAAVGVSDAGRPATSKPAAATRAPSTSEAARLPGARRPAQP